MPKEMIIGLDVGGTHTDVVLLSKQGVLKQIKVATDKENLLNSVQAGLESVTQDINSDEIERVVLSTTLTTNAIVEKKLSPVGMIVSSGPGLNPQFYNTGDHYYCVSGAIDHRGRIVAPINEKEIEDIAQKMLKDGIKNVGIVSKFCIRNPGHENQIKSILGNRFENIILGHNISGNLNFPRRIATTFLNASVYPVHKNFFEAIQNSLKRQGLSAPIYILKADAGTMNFESSLNNPGQTILSGPAASVMGSQPFASETGDTLVLDIGGTTTDMAIFVNKIPLLNLDGIELGGYKTLIRALQTNSIGIGGDSAIEVENGNLKIGPHRKGPAMAFGGSIPTPTDALIVLGEQIKNGDKDAAKKGFDTLANELGISVEEAAKNTLELASQKILNEAQKMIDKINSKPVYNVHEIYDGFQVNPKEVLVLGGPAPFFASRLKSMSDYKVKVVPQWGVANAIGAALARTTCQVTLFADTEQGKVSAPEEDFVEKIGQRYGEKDAINHAYNLLRQKALKRGAVAENMETEILECAQFNMVRGFYTSGKNIRVKMQVKPGLLKDFEEAIVN